MIRLLLSAAVLVAVSLPATSQEYQNCSMYPGGSASATSNYEQVGPAACAQLCAATEGCTGWGYTPHNFNPDSAPGECRTMPVVGDIEASDRNFCGQISG